MAKRAKRNRRPREWTEKFVRETAEPGWHTDPHTPSLTLVVQPEPAAGRSFVQRRQKRLHQSKYQGRCHSTYKLCA